jgi:pyocin large subunit-like protein
VPFKNVYERDSHFERHGKDFGAATEADYEAMADQFMCYGPQGADVRDCTRLRLTGEEDYLRMDMVKTDFGVTCLTTGFLRTFYRPPTIKIWNRGGARRFLTYECARVI